MTSTPVVSWDELKTAAAGLLCDWARLLAPHFGSSGSMDLDLIDWPEAQGPSFYNQFSPAALLLLSDGAVPGANDRERAHYRQLALANLAYSTAITDEGFHTPHYSRGRDWGRHIGEWLVYYQLCGLRQLEARGDAPAELLTRLRTVVMGATEHAYADFKKRFAGDAYEFPGNHAVWHGLLFAAAGRYFGREDWTSFAEDFMRRYVLPFLDEAGCWKEAGGIVVGYSMVTALAVSLYAELTNDSAARAAAVRAAGLHDCFFLPDASLAVVADVRMRHYATPSVHLPPGFLHTERGRWVALRSIEGMREHLRQAGVHDNSAQAFAFYGSFCEWLFSQGSAPASLPSDWQPPAQVAVVTEGPWRGFLSWQLVPEWGENRFVLDAQNFVELWHDQAGYVAGTGNSKFMPRFSTLRQTSHGRAYVPKSTTGQQINPTRAHACYRWATDEMQVVLSIEEETLAITVTPMSASTKAAYEFGLMLAVKPGDVLHGPTGTLTADPTVLLQLGNQFTWRELHWNGPAGMRMEYPVVPHNSYTQDGLPKPEAYVARLSFPVPPGGGTLRISP